MPLRRRFFWPVLSAVLLAHALALSLPGLRQSGLPVTAGAAPGPGLPVLQIRAIAPSVASAAAPAGGIVPTRWTPTADAPAASPARPDEASRPSPGVAEPDPPALPPVAAAPAAAAEASVVPAAASVYLPRSELTLPARLLGDLQVPFPADVAGVVDLRVGISLFVEPDGTVTRVRLDTPDVHPAFAREITRAFGAARFEPGRLNDLAVRALVRLEVAFHAPPGGLPSRQPRRGAPRAQTRHDPAGRRTEQVRSTKAGCARTDRRCTPRRVHAGSDGRLQTIMGRGAAGGGRLQRTSWRELVD